jgi:DNA-binding MarR family transcriptional regulator
MDAQVFIAISALLRLAQLLEAELRSYAKKHHQMGIGDMRVLFALRRTGDAAVRPADIFRSLAVTSGAVAKQIDRLGQRGLIERIPHPKRKGGWQIRLTEQGAQVADTALTAIYHTFNMSNAFRTLSREEQLAGNAFLSHLIAGYFGETS